MVAIGCLVGLTVTAAHADCTATTSSGTMDAEVAAVWCPSSWNTYWNALHLDEESEWTDFKASGSGQCWQNNLDVRMMNAAAILDMITNARKTTSLNLAKFDWLWDHVALHSDSGYDTTCENGSAIATNDAGATSIHLGFWKKSVGYRGAVLVHEAVHDWSSHVGDDECYAKGSCDDEFGKSNANTWTVVYYDHAVASYKLRPASTELLPVNFGNDMCGYMPLLSPFEREDMRAKMEKKLNESFATPPPYSQWPVTEGKRGSEPGWDYGGNNFEVDHFLGTRWGCTKVCDPNDYVWPNGNKACDESHQPGNQQVNQSNKAKCVAANALIAAGVTPAQRQQAAQQLKNTTQSCVPGYSDAYLDQYCANLTGTSSTVPQLESKWDLDDEPSFDSGQALAACERSFCDVKFKPAWIAQARSACYEWNDDIGCVRAVCGDLTTLGLQYGNTSQEYFDAVNCRRNYFEHGGNANAYYTSEESGRCELQYVACVNAKERDAWLLAKQNGTCNLVPPQGSLPWSGNYQLQAISNIANAEDYNSFQNAYPNTDISQCVLQKQLCETVEKTVSKWGHKLVAEGYQVAPTVQLQIDLPNPPPFERLSTAGHQQIRELCAVVAGKASSAITPDQAGKMLRATPQASFILADLLGRNTYFAALGASGREAVFGRDAVRSGTRASMCATCATTPAQETIIRELAAGKIVRERAESATIARVLRRAQKMLSQEERFGYAKRLTAATSSAEINDILDAIGKRVGIR
jgi:hypothetical protein